MNNNMKGSKISLALSGGGTRAMAFHAGVIKFLAESQKLENISKISTVSGGSLLVSLIYEKSGWCWPDSKYYISTIYESIREDLCKKSLQNDMVLNLLNPINWKFIFSRANLLANILYEKWGVKIMLSDVPCYPEWSINGTTAETGRRFRFRHDSLGDYTLGYASTDDFLLSDAVSVSAAFPGGIGPYSLQTDKFRWLKSDWGDEKNIRNIELPYKKINIYDGGLYDNLGLEPFFEHGKQEPKENNETIICSDAGAPFKNDFDSMSLSPWRLKRITDIISEQSRALRVRTFVHYLLKNNSRGAYFGIANSEVRKEHEEISNFSINYSTSLKQFKFEDFDKIATHGYLIAKHISDKFNFNNK